MSAEPRGLCAPPIATREEVRFRSGDADCAAWYYAGGTGACVVMAGGLAVTRGPGTDRFAARFQQAGLSVLAFDYRRLGDSGGQPRQAVRIRHELADWDAAVRFATALPGVDPARIAVWGFSSSGGHVLNVAAHNQSVAAAIAQTPNADGGAAARNAMRHQRPGAILRLVDLAALDALRRVARRDPVVVPLAGPPGTVAVLTTPDAQDFARALDPDGRYPQWRQKVAAASALTLGFYRPGRFAPRISCPLLVVVADDDQSALPGPAMRAARRAPRGELVRVPGAHYAPFLDAHEQTVAAEIAFLRRHLLGGQR